MCLFLPINFELRLIEVNIAFVNVMYRLNIEMIKMNIKNYVDNGKHRLKI